MSDEPSDSCLVNEQRGLLNIIGLVVHFQGEIITTSEFSNTWVGVSCCQKLVWHICTHLVALTSLCWASPTSSPLVLASVGYGRRREGLECAVESRLHNIWCE